MDLRKLTQVQKLARNGMFVGAMSAYIQWLAARIEDIQRSLPNEVAALRDELGMKGAHGRTAANAAAVIVRWKYFLEFAADISALTATEKDRVMGQVREAICEAAEAQSEHVATSDPAERFLVLVASALSSGRAHVRTSSTPEVETDSEPAGMPRDWGRWGWKLSEAHSETTKDFDGTGSSTKTTRIDPQGSCIGYLDEHKGDLFLIPSAAFGVAQRLARDTGDPLGTDELALSWRLMEKGLLASTGHARRKNGRVTTPRCRRTLSGRKQYVLHVRAEELGVDIPPGAEDGEQLVSRPADAASEGGTPAGWVQKQNGYELIV